MIVFFILSLLIISCYFIIILLAAFGFNNEQKQSAEKHDSQRSISVVIPFRNEEHKIINCLQSLVNQDYDLSKVDVILVNDHSDDNSVIEVEKFIKEYSFFKLIHLKEKKLKKEALKLGIHHAKYDLIAFTDADCLLPKNWFQIISSQAKDNQMLIGPVKMHHNRYNFLNAFQRLDFMAIQGVTFGFFNIGKPILNNAANLVVNRIAFKEVNGFDNYNTPSGDDVFLLEKFLDHSMKVRACLKHEYIVATETEKSWKLFFNQRFRWASKFKFYQNPWLKFISCLIFFTNFTIAFIYLGLMFVENYTIYLLFLLVAKWLIDFILLFLVASFYKQKRDLLYFIPVQIVYPIYIVGTAITSVFFRYTWKGRKING